MPRPESDNESCNGVSLRICVLHCIKFVNLFFNGASSVASNMNQLSICRIPCSQSYVAIFIDNPVCDRIEIIILNQLKIRNVCFVSEE